MRTIKAKGAINMSIKQCRQACKLSIGSIANTLGITPEEYMFYEDCPEETPIDIALKFSNIVGVPYDNIFFGSHSN